VGARGARELVEAIEAAEVALSEEHLHAVDAVLRTVAA
jgi:aryl-alcohol dehydrogenase-like predicted oxidoreductase